MILVLPTVKKVAVDGVALRIVLYICSLLAGEWRLVESFKRYQR